VLLLGEVLDELTWGGDSKDLVYAYMNSIPASFLYDRDGTFSHTNLVMEINSNQYQWQNHLGHANVGALMSFLPPDISLLTNNVYYLGYSQGCFAGSVDGRNSSGEFTGNDSMAEHFTVKTGNGAFAFIANTRYGFYLKGRNDGPSNVYDWEFARAMFTDKIYNLGAALDKAKEECVGMMADSNMMRWARYTLMLMGDPHVPMQFECDEDQDGFDSIRCGGEDCDDGEESIYPGQVESCDGIDNDCVGGPAPDETDVDKDGQMPCQGDCDDGKNTVYTGANEICDDGLDNDCNDLTDNDDPACFTDDDDLIDDDDNIGLGDDDDSNGDVENSFIRNQDENNCCG